MVRQKGYSVPLPRASQCRNIDLSWVETRMYSYPNVGSKDFIYQCDLNARYQLEGAVCPMHIRWMRDTSSGTQCVVPSMGVIVPLPKSVDIYTFWVQK